MRAREDSRSLDIVARKAVFNRRTVLKDRSRSHSAEVLTGCRGFVTAGECWDRNHDRIQLEL